MSKLFKKTLIMMILGFGVIATVVSACAGLMLYNRILEEYKSKAIAIANNIARSSIEVFLNRDASTIQSIVDQYHEIGGVSYVVVVHPDGQILSHTFAPQVPHEIKGLLERPRENKEEVVVTNVRLKGRGNFLDVSSPILSGVAGDVHVGMNLDRVTSYSWRLILWLHLATFVVFVAGVAIAFMLTNTISLPLKELTDYANKVAGRDFSAVVDIRSKDEIGVLAVTMTNMAAEIKTRMATLEREVADATQELQETLAYVSAIIESLADGLLVLDEDGRISRTNPALSDILELDYDPQGHSVRDLLGSEAADFLKDKGRELAIFYQSTVDPGQPGPSSPPFLLEGGRPANTAEVIALKGDGSRFPIELSVSVVNMRGEWNTIGIVRDITVRKRAEEALRTSERKYRGFFEHAVDGIFQTDARGRMVSVNPASAQILGYDSPQDLIDDVKRLGDGLYVESQRREEFIRLMQAGKIVHGFEVELRRKDGTSVWTTLHARPILDENGELLFTEGIVEDVTERKSVLRKPSWRAKDATGSSLTSRRIPWWSIRTEEYSSATPRLPSSSGCKIRRRSPAANYSISSIPISVRRSSRESTVRKKVKSHRNSLKFNSYEPTAGPGTWNPSRCLPSTRERIQSSPWAATSRSAKRLKRHCVTVRNGSGSFSRSRRIASSSRTGI